MRLSRADLRRRINGDLSLRYEASGLTSFAGLELFGRFFRSLDLRDHLRRVQAAVPGSDFGSVPMVLLVLVMLITGARRIGHVDYLRGDALVARVCGLKRIATRHTVGRWLVYLIEATWSSQCIPSNGSTSRKSKPISRQRAFTSKLPGCDRGRLNGWIPHTLQKRCSAVRVLNR